MPWSFAALNEAITKLKELCKWVGLLEPVGAVLEPLTQVSTEIAKLTNTFAANDIIVFTSIVGGEGLETGVPYFVLASELSGAQFKLSGTKEGPPEVWGSAITGGKVVKIKEVSGGSPAYKRKKLTVGAVAKRIAKDESAPAIDVPACTVAYEGYWNEEAGGILIGISPITPNEVIGSQNIYTVTTTTLALK